MKKRLFFILTASILFSSCGFVLKKIVGIKNPKETDNEVIRQYAQEYNIPDEMCYIIDTALYINNIYPLSKKNKKLANDLLQPLQVRAYGSDTMFMFLINCNVGGFPNLEWNTYNSFNSFPPDMKSFPRVDTAFSFENDIKYYRDLKGKSINNSLFNDNDLNIIIYWAVFMDKQSKILITELLNYKNKYSDKNIKLMFVNVDNLFAKLEEY